MDKNDWTTKYFICCFHMMESRKKTMDNLSNWVKMMNIDFNLNDLFRFVFNGV